MVLCLLLSNCTNYISYAGQEPVFANAVTNKDNFIVREVEINNGKGEIVFAGISKPHLMFFSYGEPDQKTLVSYELETVPLPLTNPSDIQVNFSDKVFSFSDIRDFSHEYKFVTKSNNKPPVYQPGELEKFWLETDKPGVGRFEQHTFKLMSATQHLYIWLDTADRDIFDLQLLPSLARYWETVAYPLSSKYFGLVPHPQLDIDHDPHIYLLLTSTTGDARAYFNTLELLPQDEDEAKHANYHKTLVIGNTYLDPQKRDMEQLLATLIHEYQHLNNFYQKGYLAYRQKNEPLWEDSWLDEGLSVYAEQIGGLALPGEEKGTINDVAYFLEKNSQAPLITDDFELIDYAASYLFVTYLADRFGSNIIKSLLSVDKTGVEAVEAVTKTRFVNIFADWGISLYASGLTSHPRFSYKSINLRQQYGGHFFHGIVPQKQIKTFPFRNQQKIRNWTLNYLALQTKNERQNLKVKITVRSDNLKAFIIGTN